MIKIKSESDLKKKCLILGFEDVLIPGMIEKDFKMKTVFGILQNLKRLEERFPRFKFFVISGFSETEGLKRIRKYNLEGFLTKEKIFFVSEEYLKTKNKLEKSLYDSHIQKNPEFKDEYFKQVIIEQIGEKFSYRKDEMVFVGHDLWTEGYYTVLFSKIDFALIKTAHSSLGVKKSEEIKNLIYINRTWGDFEKLLMGKFPKANYSFLENFVLDNMREKLFEGTKLGALTKFSKS